MVRIKRFDGRMFERKTEQDTVRARDVVDG